MASTTNVTSASTTKTSTRTCASSKRTTPHATPTLLVKLIRLKIIKGLMVNICRLMDGVSKMLRCGSLCAARSIRVTIL